MTRYAYDSGAGTLVATWGTGRGDVAETIAEVPGAEHGVELAAALASLARFQWRTYTHPATAAGDPDVVNGEAWRRAEERNRFAKVEAALRTPNLPDDDGCMLVFYSPIEESAHHVGRVLHAIGDASLVDRVVNEVLTEQAAITAAELGDLAGRARQAVELTRPEISPVQVHAADTLLRANPLGTIDLFTELDPAAASVAAAHWLRAAATVAGEVTGLEPVDVVAEADDIEALQVETPTVVLERLGAGETPTQVVVDLIADAIAVSEGKVRDLDGIIEAAQEIEERDDEDDDLDDWTDGYRICRLDPTRPAIDLLEDLLGAIRGCWLVFSEADSGATFEDAVRTEADADTSRLQ
ncbi:hypothetical protein ACFVJ5_16615 [Nocardia sp. NPDC127606]|uniref:hypothetical protein n=1 Tax=Nocardia sp. NPDC127606 TaxID=3345406 RepID=UPI00363C20BA